MQANVLFVVTIMALLQGCRQGIHTSEGQFPGQIEIDMSQGAAVFVEIGRSRFSPIGSSFGDVVLVDFATSTKHYITRDDYLDDKPALSPDGRFVAFVSARIGNPMVLKIAGEGAPKQLYIHDLRSHGTRWLDSLFAEHESRRGGWIESIAWAPRGDILYFTRGDNTIDAITIRGDSLWQVARFDNEQEHIVQMAVSPDGGKIACSHYEFEDERGGIFLYDFRLQSRTDVCQGRYPWSLHGWFTDGRRLLLSQLGSLDSLFWSCDLTLNNRLTPIPIRPDSSMGDIFTGSVGADGSLVLLAAHGMATEGDTTLHWGDDIARYHIATRQLEWITNDQFRKSSLSVLPVTEKASD
jgi:hypothetical protein